MFEEYYARQKIVKDGREVSSFVTMLQRPLQITFRLHATHPATSKFIRRLEALQLPESEEIKVSGHTMHYLMKPLPYLDSGIGTKSLCYQIGTSRAGLVSGSKKHEVLSKLNELLKEGADLGLLMRQEVVSMLPCLLLGIQ